MYLDVSGLPGSGVGSAVGSGVAVGSGIAVGSGTAVGAVVATGALVAVGALAVLPPPQATSRGNRQMRTARIRERPLCFM